MKHPPKQSVECAMCSAALMRRPLRPYDGKPIARFFCNRQCKGRWQQTQKPVDADWLRQKYEVERLDCVQIAAIVRRNPKQVWAWLRGYGIPTRPRGDSSRLSKGRAPGFTLSATHREQLRQARLRDGHFPKQPSGRPYWSGKTGTNHPAWKGGCTPERQAFYASLQWRDACRIVWRRANAKCERCSEDHRQIDRSRRAFHVHHIVSFAVADLRAEPTNLALLCDKCHRFVHSRHNTTKEFIGRMAA